MKPRQQLAYLGCLATGVATLAWFGIAPAQTEIEVSPGDRSSEFRFQTKPGKLYRIETSAGIESWHPIRTIEGDGGLYNHNSQMVGRGQQFFRAVELDTDTALTGDYIATTAGDVLIHPISHATFVMQWNGKTIYNDPVGDSGAFAGIPAADLILVGHRHGDHLSTSTIDAVRGAAT